jgi:hypothetical protein
MREIIDHARDESHRDPGLRLFDRDEFTAWSNELPGLPLYVGSEIREAPGREAETDGCTPAMKLADWRAGIESAVTAFAAQNNADWLHFVDMTGWVPQDELVIDGMHPSVEGHIEMCQAVASYFHQPGNCGVPR